MPVIGFLGGADPARGEPAMKRLGEIIRELCAQEPFSIAIDEPFVDQLTELITPGR